MLTHGAPRPSLEDMTEMEKPAAEGCPCRAPRTHDVQIRKIYSHSKWFSGCQGMGRGPAVTANGTGLPFCVVERLWN